MTACRWMRQRSCWGTFTTWLESEPAVYSLSADRSAVNMERTKAFPRNTEIDVLLTFTSDGAKASDTGGGKRGSRFSDVALTVQAVTVQQHHSFVKLPIPGSGPLPFDARAGAFGVWYLDYSAALSESIRSALSRATGCTRRIQPPPWWGVEPIVYYLDRGRPSRSDQHCSRALAGGTRPLRLLATGTRFV